MSLVGYPIVQETKQAAADLCQAQLAKPALPVVVFHLL
jgi:hypothetical protein